jgi:hypothetical protein
MDSNVYHLQRTSTFTLQRREVGAAEDIRAKTNFGHWLESDVRTLRGGIQGCQVSL